MSHWSRRELEAAGEEAGVSTAHIVAVAEVEAPSGPFLFGGHPTVLFERHKFSAYTGRRWDDDHPDISSPSRGGYGPTRSQPARLARARELDDVAAVMSTSWGSFQIMGFNWSVCGYPSVQEFEAGMWESAGEHLRAFSRFLAREGLGRLLAAGDWAGFARRYNGPAYHEHNYHGRLEAAHARAVEELGR